MASVPRVDFTTGLTAYLVLLLCLPSQLIFAPLGAAGTPAQVLGMAFLLYWSVDWLSRSHPRSEPLTPVRRAMLCLGAAYLLSFALAQARPLPGDEGRSCDRVMLTVCSWLGVVLIAESVRNRARLDVFLRRLVALVAAVAALGLFQFVTKRAWIDHLHVPGLVLNSTLAAVDGRLGFARPAATTSHPIEFGVVLTMVLPLALHYAYLQDGRPWWRRWWPPAMLALAIPISISRSALLAAIVGMLVLLPSWPRSKRRPAYGLMVLLGLTVYVAIPGLLGAIRGLFLGIQDDSSARSRTDSYAIVWEFVKRAPFFGRGPGTFLPSYRILDNQYLGTLIETGLLGLVALLALLVVAVVGARRVRARSVDPATRDLAQSLAAGVAAGGVTFATFDGLGFPVSAGLMLVLLGSVAALQRLESRTGSSDQVVGLPALDPAARPGLVRIPSPRPVPLGSSWRGHLLLVMSGLVLLAVAAGTVVSVLGRDQGVSSSPTVPAVPPVPATISEYDQVEAAQRAVDALVSRFAQSLDVDERRRLLEQIRRLAATPGVTVPNH